MTHLNELKYRRKLLRYTQRELAEFAGVSESTVSYAERGARLSLAAQRAIAGVLEVDPETLWPTTREIPVTAAENTSSPTAGSSSTYDAGVEAARPDAG